MAYVTEQQIIDRIPLPLLNDALDDDGDGNPDQGLLTQIIADESQKVEAFLGGRFTVPFPDAAPAAVREAARSFVLYAIWTRRPSVGDPPKVVVDDFNFWRNRLQKIGNNELPLDANSTAGAPIATAQAGSAIPVPGRLSLITPPTPPATPPTAGNADDVFED
jgi:phage gp36-like protein